MQLLYFVQEVVSYKDWRTAPAPASRNPEKMSSDHIAYPKRIAVMQLLYFVQEVMIYKDWRTASMPIAAALKIQPDVFQKCLEP